MSKIVFLPKAKNFLKLIFLPRVLNRKERLFAGLFLCLIILGALGISLNNYFSGARVLPAEGGTYREAILGYPQSLNPVFSHANDVDRDIVRLIYSGLTKFDSEGNIIPDLAEDFTISEYGKVYDFFLRKNVLWHDEKPFKADDVVFTIKTIQNAQYNSPLRFNWDGVEVEKINDWQVRFRLKNPYAPFLTNTTIGILPQHIWEGILPEKFTQARENLYPVGTGPFILKEISFKTAMPPKSLEAIPESESQVKKSPQNLIKSITLERNDHHYLKKPYLDKIILSFHSTEQEIIDFFNRNEVDGITLSSAFKKSGIHNLENLNIFYPLLPRYFAAFFNQEKNSFLANKNLRLSLAHATNKDLIIKQVFNGKALKIEGPLLPYLFEDEQKLTTYEYNLDKAKEYLNKVAAKDKIILTISAPDMPEFKETAKILQENWVSLGIQVKISLVSSDKIIEDIIRPRDYEILIFGQVLSLDPDPFSFWHSSQKKDPGLNLALYSNKKTDMALEKARQEIDLEKRKSLYQEFQAQLTDDLPAIFLYSPQYLYLMTKKIKGVKTIKINLPADRFASIENWYIYTRKLPRN